MKSLRTIVTLCGSLKFIDEFDKQNVRLTREGKIVLSVGSSRYNNEQLEITKAEKDKLDELHLDKIYASNEVFIINVNGYIGDSTRRELAFAIFCGKNIIFLDRDKGEKYLENNKAVIAMMCQRYYEETA